MNYLANKKERVAAIIKRSPSIKKNHTQVSDMILHAIALFDEYKSQRYYSHKGKLIKRPLACHSTSAGRYNQEPARTILLSGLTRAWMVGTGKNARINNKRYRDTPFVMFATDIFHLVGIGDIYKHLEQYTSARKLSATNSELSNNTDPTS